MTDPNQQILPPPRLKVGDVEILAFNDGILPTTTAVALGIDPADVARMTGAQPEDTITMSVNEYVFRIGGKTALIDTGAADRMYPTLGLLPRNLEAAGVSPAEIDVVLLTHLHGDHMHGLVDAAGAAAFPNAEVVLHEAEAAFWIDKEPTGRPQIDKNLPDVRRNLAPYKGRIRTVADGEALPGVRAHLCPGHTPGHTAWIVESGGAAAIMWGDLVHLEKVQVARPEVAMRYDLDGEMAARSRRRTFDMCVAEGFRILGAHLSYPGFATLAREGDGFRIDYL
ncbi:MAG TPA: MBL fold metallo-hydrolase [Beijerinckiaceae bacterium]|jgi:glyoxylase-like metal-dependent hydrolase (beta-lactamase superfamily II)